MAKEKIYSEVLNLRIDRPLADEIARIAKQRETSESDTARMMLSWGVEAHRDMEAQKLLRPYDAQEPDRPMDIRICVRWEEIDPDDPDYFDRVDL